MKNVLVAGGAGFIGYHLVRKLEEQGHNVFIVDNLCTGTASHMDGKQALQLDITDTSYCENFVEKLDSYQFASDVRFDVIFNLACPASPAAYLREPVETVLTSVVGTKNLLDVARHNGSVFVQASTSEVYGDPLNSPQKETDLSHVNPYGPRSCYDSSKMAAEALCHDYRNKYGIDCRVARIFNTFGPRMLMNDGRVVSNFVVQSLLEDPITIYGDGKQTRSFCYVDDLVLGLIALSEQPTWEHGPVNLGNPDERTISELAELVVKLTRKGSVVYEPLPADDPTRRKPDITKAKTYLNWEPKVPLLEGLQKTIDWFQSEFDRYGYSAEFHHRVKK